MAQALPPYQEASDEKDMSFLQHLEELRWHLIRSVIALIITSVVAFVNKSLLFDDIILRLLNEDFSTYQFMCGVSGWMAQQLPSLVSADLICIGQSLPELKNLNMAGQFMSHIMVSLVAGIILAFPYILWEVWRFVKPALKASERKNSTGFIFSTTFLFLAGVAFGYYLIAPLSVNFFLTYEVADIVENSPTLSSYISMVTSVVMGCGLVFELPVLIFFLTKLGLVTPKTLRKYRKHAFVGCLILSAIITPPDIFSQVLVTGPLMFLYELSILLSRLVVRRAEKKAARQTA